MVAMQRARSTLAAARAGALRVGAAGTCLAAATVCATLCRKSPVGNPAGASLDQPPAKFLQTVACETVQDYFREGN